MGDSGNVGAAFKSVQDRENRLNQYFKDYGEVASGDQQKEDWAPDYAPIAGQEGDDAEVTAARQKWNRSRARWNSLSDAERLIATDEQKQFTLDYEKRRKENQILAGKSREMDQAELRSKAANSSGERLFKSATQPVLTGNPPIAEPINGKTLLGT